MTSIVRRVIAVMMIAWLGVASTQVAAASSATNHQGLWWNPQEPGWGINFALQGDIIFATLIVTPIQASAASAAGLTSR